MTRTIKPCPLPKGKLAEIRAIAEYMVDVVTSLVDSYSLESYTLYNYSKSTFTRQTTMNDLIASGMAMRY